MAKQTVSENAFLRRYNPYNRFTGSGFGEQKLFELKGFEVGESVTDKESYRLSLAQSAGNAAALGSALSNGQYMYPDGKYDVTKDISYILRSDLTIAEVDDYIDRVKKRLESDQKSLSDRVKEELEALEAAREERLAQETESESTGE